MENEVKMNTSMHTVASILATTIWADGEYSEIEAETALDIADGFGYEAEAFHAAIAEAIEEVKDMDEASVHAYLEKHAAAIDENEVAMVFEAVLFMLVCDNMLDGDEVNNMLAIADVLGVDTATAVLLLCDKVKDEPEMEISFESEDE